MLRNFLVRELNSEQPMAPLNFQDTAKLTVTRNQKPRHRHMKSSTFDEIQPIDCDLDVPRLNFKGITDRASRNLANSTGEFEKQNISTLSQPDEKISWILTRLDKHEREIKQLKLVQPAITKTAFDMEASLKESQLIQFKINNNFEKAIASHKQTLIELKDSAAQHQQSMLSLESLIRTAVVEESQKSSSAHQMVSLFQQIHKLENRVTDIKGQLDSKLSKIAERSTASCILGMLTVSFNTQSDRIGFPCKVRSYTTQEYESPPNMVTKHMSLGPVGEPIRSHRGTIEKWSHSSQPSMETSNCTKLCSYSIDSDGYLLDEESSYLMDDRGGYIKVGLNILSELQRLNRNWQV